RSQREHAGRFTGPADRHAHLPGGMGREHVAPADPLVPRRAHVHSVRQNQVSTSTWAAAFDHGYYFILNLAIGGECPAKTGGGPAPATASGGERGVDDVTVQARAGSGGTPSPTPVPSPTPTPAPTPVGGTPARCVFPAEAYSAESGAVVEPTTD